jgi:ferredoxin
MSRPLWLVELIKKAFPGRFLFAGWTKTPVLGGVLERWLFEGDDLIYLPQERVGQTIQVGQTLDTPGDVILPSQAGVHWIMDACLCRSANRCEDYPIDLGCLFLGEAALGINPRLGRRVTKAEALAHVRRCREAGLVHLIGRNKLDTIWLGVSPGDRLLTICNCCPCCCLWRVLPHVAPRLAAKVTRMPGVAVRVNPDRCVGCGTCMQDVCFVDAIQVVDGRAVISDACRGCGRCVSVCPEGAIEMTLDEEVVGRTIARIAPLVDVS